METTTTPPKGPSAALAVRIAAEVGNADHWLAFFDPFGRWLPNDALVALASCPDTLAGLSNCTLVSTCRLKSRSRAAPTPSPACGC